MYAPTTKKELARAYSPLIPLLTPTNPLSAHKGNEGNLKENRCNKQMYRRRSSNADAGTSSSSVCLLGRNSITVNCKNCKK